MNYGQQENTRVKEQLVNGLFEELQHKPFSEIRIASLIKTAGVGRTSYYRNFDSKEDVLNYYLSQLIMQRRKQKPIIRWTRTSFTDDLTETFKFFLKQKKRFLLLFNAGLSAYIFEYFHSTANNAKTEERGNEFLKKPYLLAFVAGALPSVLFEWLKRDSPESPEEMAKMVVALLPAELFTDETHQ
ncbi:TetR family transcriptional regulator C-terminal domain-containing protein [Periweissella fabaria]|uniref:HTH tetR-type domain-containing protein n=1 Tax=Periweissella fabaria TaxID=546157 RepID=A0ABN8BKC6_9LACO|nr:TetR-like C-terminal domain-containing protein [Periweissella fabaria]MCM0596438.1 TetR family transcriptional regulator C-terminal domain-containing protein [Periweissella fabaria]CAH0415834.1 hypothetical protein WFA24289_00132 [Periweissella fabaria]